MPLATRCLKIPRSSKPNKIMGSRSFRERTLLRRNSDGWNLRTARQFFATDLVFSGNRTPTEISLAGIQASLRRPSTMAQGSWPRRIGAALPHSRRLADDACDLRDSARHEAMGRPRGYDRLPNKPSITGAMAIAARVEQGE
jgi:hypothetical protein